MNDLNLPRPTVLLVSYADQYLEAYTTPGVDIRLTRVPWGVTPPEELESEEVLLSLLPRRFRPLLRADCLRLSGTTRPLTPNVLADSQQVQKWIDVLNQLPQLPTDATEETEETMQWTL